MTYFFRKSLICSSAVVMWAASAMAQVPAPPPPTSTVPENSGTARPAPAPTQPPGSGAPASDPVANTPADPQSPGAVILPGPGTPPVDKPRPLTPISKFDLDGDGRLTQEEAKGDAVIYNKFKAMDANKDGFVSSDEFAASGMVPAPISKPAK